MFFSVINHVVFPVSDYTPGAPSVIFDVQRHVSDYTVGNSSVIRGVRKHGRNYTKLNNRIGISTSAFPRWCPWVVYLVAPPWVWSEGCCATYSTGRFCVINFVVFFVLDYISEF